MSQPGRPGPNRQEKEANRTQGEHLQHAPDATPAEAARQVAAEVGKAATLQPTPRRKS